VTFCQGYHRALALKVPRKRKMEMRIGNHEGPIERMRPNVLLLQSCDICHLAEGDGIYYSYTNVLRSTTVYKHRLPGLSA
jgi:hypothetical protein